MGEKIYDTWEECNLLVAGHEKGGNEKAKTIQDLVGWGEIGMAKGSDYPPQPTLRLPARSASPFENQPIDHMGKS